MEQFREFNARDIDDAIAAACVYFDVERSRLEIDIVEGGSSGLFGIVGKKKAQIRARLRPLAGEKYPAGAILPENSAKQPRSHRQHIPSPGSSRKAAPGTIPKAVPKAMPKTISDTEETAHTAPADAQPALNLDAAQRRQIDEAIKTTLCQLLKDIAPQAEFIITHRPDRIHTHIEDSEHSGLIIGRDGQTIAALQYLTNRIVARKLDMPIRVHLDAGDYRKKQNDNLTRLAQHLAHKAKAQSRTQSTKPLSSYHRRLVHMALQSDTEIFTRSSGEGPLKRVIISVKNRGRQQYR